MWLVLLFRVCLLSGFLLSAWKWGDWKNWHKYYATILFVMVVNLSAGYISYHHPLWIYNDDAIFTTEMSIEYLNTYLALPAVTLVYLSKFPLTGIASKCAYMLMWVIVFSTIEYIDTRIAGLSYSNGWEFKYSIVFDCFMFLIIRTHYIRPFWGWLIAIVVAAFILTTFHFFSGEMK